MWKYAALISYRGTIFCGWQKQKGASSDGTPSIQETFETALSSVASEAVSVVGSGRTDSGVHALGQVVHFVLKRREWKPEILVNGLNSRLPIDIRVIRVYPVELSFHAQRSATKKQYSYYFQQGPCALPHLEPYSWWIRKRLNLEAMNEGLGHLVGTHDFKPFQSRGAKVGSTVRTILEAQVHWENIPFPEISGVQTESAPFGLVRVRLVGTGFLKQMVRGIAGTLLQIGENRRDPNSVAEIIRSGDRKKVGPTAPGRALWLEFVAYE